jgi:hypothetical protein
MRFRLAGIYRSRVLYELDYKKPILYVIPVDSILGKQPVVPIGDTGTIPHSMRNLFPARPETAGRVQGTVAGCGLSIRGLWAGPAMKADGVETTWRHIAKRSATYMFYYSNYVHYITYFILNDLINIIDII